MPAALQLLGAQAVGFAEPSCSFWVLAIQLVFPDRELKVITPGIIGQLLEAGESLLFRLRIIASMDAVAEVAMRFGVVGIELNRPLKMLGSLACMPLFHQRNAEVGEDFWLRR